MAWSLGMLISRARDGLYGSKKHKMILFGIMIIMVTVLILIYIARRITQRDLVSQEIISKPFKLYAGGSLSKTFLYSASKIPSSKNGIEFTYSFWLYTSSFDITSLPKLIFTRGFDSTYGSASPVVYMDAKTNSLHFSVRTNVSNTNANLSTLRARTSRFLNATVEYVPMQRWVQFALIVKDNIMTILMDGQLYTIENVLDMQTPRIKPLIRPHSGDLSIGSMAGSAGLKGYITKFDIFNYAINISDMKLIYNKALSPLFVGPPSSYIFDWLTMAVVLLILFVNMQQRKERDKPLESVASIGDQGEGDGDNLLIESFGNDTDNCSGGDVSSNDMISKYMKLLQSTVTTTSLPNDAKGLMFAESNNNTASTTTTTTTAPYRHVNVKQTQEALPESILANLTLFVTTTTYNRLNTGDDDVMVWKNLASQSTSEKVFCTNGSVASPDLRFNRKPALLDNETHRPAFNLGTGTSLTGPPSHHLGIDGDRSFGILFVARMTLPNHKAEASMKAIQIFANTSSNNALTLMFLPEPQTVGVRIGSGDVILGDPKDFALRKPIYPEQFYLWMVSKSYSEVQLTAVNLENHILEPITMLRATMPSLNEQLILSNLPLTINADYKWNAGLMAFGISSNKFVANDVLELAQHYRTIFKDMDPEVLAFKKNIRALTDNVDATKECPFDKDTCFACEDAVIDWSRPDWYLGDVDDAVPPPRCLRAIASFCSANPTHERCACWAAAKAKDSACRKYRSIFDGSSAEDPPKCPEGSVDEVIDDHIDDF
eukprot:gene17275-biopygen26189